MLTFLLRDVRRVNESPSKEYIQTCVSNCFIARELIQRDINITSTAQYCAVDIILVLNYELKVYIFIGVLSVRVGLLLRRCGVFLCCVAAVECGVEIVAQNLYY